jgi:UDP-N-acetylmuramate dehydrogenase
MNMAELHTFSIANAGLRGSLRANEPMARHVSWRVGGVAARAYVPADLADLCTFLRSLPQDEPVLFCGLGSNLLVRDGGFRGSVVLTHTSHGEIRLDAAAGATSGGAASAGLVYAQAGVASPKVARFAATHGFEGAEFLAGVPGTVGGALAMNAGCYGSETWQFVERVQVMTHGGELRERSPAEYSVGYRHVALNTPSADEWFSAAWFRFTPGDGARARERIKELLAKRIASQPLNLPNAGSVFRNPEGDHAARLIEASGLKGFAIGGARISEKHANFIVTPGGRASAVDIEVLIEHARATVLAKHGVALIPEVRIVGEKADNKIGEQA